jgi:GNAT superfamily N-acetyltransferase
MATASSHRGTGAGKLVLDALEQAARDRNAAIIWCKARSSAKGFYAKAGWQIASEEFEIASFGPHFVMKKVLAPPAE